jgi:hypothetical protein
MWRKLIDLIDEGCNGLFTSNHFIQRTLIFHKLRIFTDNRKDNQKDLIFHEIRQPLQILPDILLTDGVVKLKAVG